MRRRAFIKRAGLFVPATFGILRAQSLFSNPGFVGSVNVPAAAAGGGGPTFIFQENFEDASVGFDGNNAGGWTNSGGCNAKYATSPAPLAGTQSLRMPADEYVWRDFTASDEVWFYCLFNGTTRATSGNGIFTIRNAATVLFKLLWDHDNSDRLRIYVPTANDLTTAGISASNTYSIWGHYKKGTGANAVGDIEWQVAGTPRVGSGNNYRQVTTGEATAQANRIYLHNDGATDVHLMDTVKLTSDGYYSP